MDDEAIYSGQLQIVKLNKAMENNSHDHFELAMYDDQQTSWWDLKKSFKYMYYRL